jgi:hypothetical protein
MANSITTSRVFYCSPFLLRVAEEGGDGSRHSRMAKAFGERDTGTLTPSRYLNSSRANKAYNLASCVVNDGVLIFKGVVGPVII